MQPTHLSAVCSLRALKPTACCPGLSCCAQAALMAALQPLTPACHAGPVGSARSHPGPLQRPASHLHAGALAHDCLLACSAMTAVLTPVCCAVLSSTRHQLCRLPAELAGAKTSICSARVPHRTSVPARTGFFASEVASFKTSLQRPVPAACHCTLAATAAEQSGCSRFILPGLQFASGVSETTGAAAQAAQVLLGLVDSVVGAHLHCLTGRTGHSSRPT